MAKRKYDTGTSGIIDIDPIKPITLPAGFNTPAPAPIDWNAVAAAFATPAPAAEAAPAQSSDPGIQAFLDAQYAKQEANLRAQLGFKMAQLDQDDANDETSYREALRRLETQQPRDQQAAKESANKAGLFYSGTLGKNIGDINASYARKSSDMTQARQQRGNQRAAQKQALASGLDIDLGNLAEEAATRKLQSDQDAADSGYLVRDMGTAATAAQPITVKITPQAQQVKANAVKMPKIKPLPQLKLLPTKKKK